MLNKLRQKTETFLLVLELLVAILKRDKTQVAIADVFLQLEYLLNYSQIAIESTFDQNPKKQLSLLQTAANSKKSSIFTSELSRINLKLHFSYLQLTYEVYFHNEILKYLASQHRTCISAKFTNKLPKVNYFAALVAFSQFNSEGFINKVSEENSSTFRIDYCIYTELCQDWVQKDVRWERGQCRL